MTANVAASRNVLSGVFLGLGIAAWRVFDQRSWWGGLLAAAGAFQLYDGTVQHKLLRLHQIRYDVDIVPYDWAWNIVAVVVLAVGCGLLWQAQRRTG
jgi:uncharacterized membrane protein